MTSEMSTPTPSTEIFKQLDEYPWDKDKEFQVCDINCCQPRLVQYKHWHPYKARLYKIIFLLHN